MGKDLPVKSIPYSVFHHVGHVLAVEFGCRFNGNTSSKAQDGHRLVYWRQLASAWTTLAVYTASNFHFKFNHLRSQASEEHYRGQSHVAAAEGQTRGAPA
jgi:hypothetical protein